VPSYRATASDAERTCSWHVFERAAVEDFARRRLAHYDKLASEGRTLPPGVKRPKPPGQS